MKGRSMTSRDIIDGHLTASRLPPTPAGSRGLAGTLLSWWHCRTAPTPRRMRLLETLPLGPKRSVALLELDGQRFLAGMGADGVHTLLQVAAATANQEEHR